MQKIISSRLAWTAAFLLTAINTYSFADRQLPSIMIPELKAELLLTDAEIGFLFGTVFAIFFGIATVIFGRLADTSYRKNVLIFAIIMWSVLTGLCGIAQQFWDLIIFRIGVGVGEAALGPIALVVFAAYFTKEKLPLALGIWGTGPFLGSALAGWGGAAIITNMDLAKPYLGVFSDFSDWRLTFFLFALPGLLFALALKFLPFPESSKEENKEQNLKKDNSHYLNYLLNPTGRTTRMDFNLQYLTITLISAIVFYLAIVLQLMILAGIVLIVSLYISIVIHIRRCHDSNKTGWLVLIPGISLYCFFKKGDPDNNRWGSIKVIKEDSFQFFFLKAWKFFLLMFIGVTITGLVGYSVLAWGIEMLVRVHDIPKTIAGQNFGIFNIFLGIGGSIGAGIIASRMIEKGIINAHLRIAGIFVILLWLSLLLFTLSFNPLYSQIGLGGMILFMSCGPGLYGAAFQSASPINLRGRTAAIYYISANVIGFALGPFALGFLNDFIFNEANGYDQTGIRYSLLWLGVILYPIAAVCFYKASKLFMPLQAEAQ